MVTQTPVERPAAKCIPHTNDKKLRMRAAVRLVDCIPSASAPGLTSIKPRSRSSRLSNPVALNNYSPLTPELISQLVMPSEDWFVNTYPIPQSNNSNFTVFTISEAILTINHVEIIKKSITIKSDWTVKFIVLGCEVPDLKIELSGNGKLYEIQKILCYLAEISLCTGIEVNGLSFLVNFLRNLGVKKLENILMIDIEAKIVY